MKSELARGQDSQPRARKRRRSVANVEVAELEVNAVQTRGASPLDRPSGLVSLPSGRPRTEDTEAEAITGGSPVRRVARRRGELRRDGGDTRVRGAIAARKRLNTDRPSTTRPHRPGSDVHAQAIERLRVALENRDRVNEESDAAQGGHYERTAAVALAAANEQVSAREAWLKYVEHGY